MRKDVENTLEFEINTEQLGNLCRLLSILSKLDTLTLFLHAKHGLKAETETPKKVGLSKKQYYTRLKQLVDSELVVKHDGCYFHTTMGRFVYEKHLASLIEGLNNVKQMRMIDVLKRERALSEQEIANLEAACFIK